MSLKSFTDKYETGLQPLIFIATFIAGLALVAMMMVTVWDIFLRFVFHRSMAGAFEITEFTLAIMAPLALIYCEKKRHHISVDLVMQFFSEKIQLIVDLIMSLLTALIYFLVAWQCWINIFENKMDQLTSPVLLWPVWIFIIPSAVGFFLLFLLILDHTLKVIMKLQGKEVKP